CCSYTASSTFIV
nr:immunoglobulin light chain junction region [Macaca mulatta]